MRIRTASLFALIALLALGTLAWAGDEASSVTVTGKIACAKCTLQMADATECQNVLVVAGKDGAEPTYYYLVKNEVSEEFGHVCKGDKAAVVTGTLAEKGGKSWITPTKMESPEA